MLKLYDKPENYENMMQNMNPEQNEVLPVCLYNAQCYINRHYQMLTQADQEDIMQETAIDIIKDINAYDSEMKVPFAAYMNKLIKMHVATAYRKVTRSFNTSACIQREASKFAKCVDEAERKLGRSLSAEEAAKLYGCKKNTAESYMRISRGIHATLDAEDEYGNIAVSKIVGNDNVEKAVLSDSQDIERLINAMSRENQFIIRTYIECCDLKGWRKKLFEKCQPKGITKAKAVKTVQLFKRKLKMVIEDERR